MIDSYTKTPRPLRHVDVDYLVDQTKCANCEDKPCLQSCPIDAIYLDEDDNLIKLKNTCFGCVLCRNACPFDAISLDVKMDPPLKETFQTSMSNYVKLVVPVFKHVKTVLFILLLTENRNLTVKLIRILVSVADIVLESVQLMQSNMVSCFQKRLKEVRQLL